MRGRGASLPGRVAAALKAAGHGVELRPTAAAGAAGRIAREAIESGADLIVSLGGDGTLNEVLAGVAHTDVPLAMIPGGTANVFAREAGLDLNPARAAARLAELVPRRVAVGVLRCEPQSGERLFLLMAGAGFDAHIVYGLNLGLKSKLGELAYWTGAVKQIGRRIEEFEVEIDGRSHTCSFALISRVRNYAGYVEIAQCVSLLDDEFEVVLFQGTSAWRFYGKYLAAIVAGRASRTQGISFHRARHVRLSGTKDARVYVQVDGEYAGRLPASVEIALGAATLLVPPGYPRNA